MALFLIVLVYHMFTEFFYLTNIWNKLKLRRKWLINDTEDPLVEYLPEDGNVGEPTTSWVDAPSHEAQTNPSSLIDLDTIETENDKEYPLLGKNKNIACQLQN